MSKRKRRLGLPPGTLVFTGEQYVKEPNVTWTQFNKDTFYEKNLSKDQSPQQTKQLVNWYDIRGVHDIELVRQIGSRFSIHPLALEDIVDTQQRPKFEEYESGIFITLRALSMDKNNMELQTEQISIYVGDHFLLSFQEDDDDLFKAIRNRLQKSDGRIRTRGSDYLAYALIDSIVDNYYVILDLIEEKIELLEEEILLSADSGIKARIHHLKLQTLMLRKSVAPLREAVSRFSNCESPLMAENTIVFVRDLHDHTIQVMDMIETYRDLVTGLNDLFISELSFKMNNVMKILTIITTIFVPLSFLAGLYGMNFDHMPELHWRYGYFALLGIMAFIFIALLLFFYKKKWL